MSVPKDSKLCLAPWTQIHVAATGRVFPCCSYDITQPVIKIGDGPKPLAEQWNNPVLTGIRKKFLAGEVPDGCRYCFEREASGFRSQRVEHNDKYEHHSDEPKLTDPLTGHHPRMKLPFIDIRFSNLCNFRCRTCGPDYSSSWYEEARELGIPEGPKKVMAVKDPKFLLEELASIVPQLEDIYFAGGEPLMSDEHYQLLEILHAQQAFDVRLNYTSNFSLLKHKNWDLFKLWAPFKHLTVGISLDGRRERAEFIRKGLRYDVLVENARQFKAQFPNSGLYLCFTLSIFNVAEGPALHREWIDMGLIGANSIIINLLTDGALFRAGLVPRKVRQQAVQDVEQHIVYLMNRFQLPAHAPEITRWRSYQEALLVDEKNESYRIDFVNHSRILDKMRGEDVFEAVPELKELKEGPHG